MIPLLPRGQRHLGIFGFTRKMVFALLGWSRDCGQDVKTSLRDWDNSGGKSQSRLHDSPFPCEGLEVSLNSLASFTPRGGVYLSTLWIWVGFVTNRMEVMLLNTLKNCKLILPSSLNPLRALSPHVRSLTTQRPSCRRATSGLFSPAVPSLPTIPTGC